MFGKTDKIHLIGIGGYGMSGLAKLLLEKGHKVSGSDLTPSDITRHLSELGAEIHIGHDVKHVEGRDLVIYSTAIPEDNDELRAAIVKGNAIHRSEMLAQFLNSKIGIAVTGAHGKTTTTTMLAVIMEKGGLDPTALIGGEVLDFSGTSRKGEGKFVVAEADESDQSFSRYRPWYSVITNIEPDHLEHWDDNFERLLEGYASYMRNIKENGFLIVPYRDQWIDKIIHNAPCPTLTFGIEEGYYQAKDVILKPLGSSFKLYRGEDCLGEIELQVPGVHNIKNAVAASGAAVELGIEFSAIRRALAVFMGAKRRFQILLREPYLIVDDYAHHPTEVMATLEAAKNAAQGQVIAIFQPHRYTRTKFFMAEFSRAFSSADIVVLDDIYAASEQPIPGITSQILADKIKENFSGKVVQLSGTNEIVQWVHGNLHPSDIVITMGAGSIWRVSHTLAENCQQELAGNFLSEVE